jgi:hypothetical protein
MVGWGRHRSLELHIQSVVRCTDPGRVLPVIDMAAEVGSRHTAAAVVDTAAAEDILAVPAAGNLGILGVDSLGEVPEAGSPAEVDSLADLVGMAEGTVGRKELDYDLAGELRTVAEGDTAADTADRTAAVEEDIGGEVETQSSAVDNLVELEESLGRTRAGEILR